MTAGRWSGRVLAAIMLIAVTSHEADAACSVESATPATFTAVTSFALKTTTQVTSTESAGLTCTGAILAVLQTGDHIYARVTSANGGFLGAAGDLVPYSLFGDASTSYPIPWGTQFDYATGQLINLLGLLGGPSADLPMYFRTATGANVAAGTYTDTITIEWSWDYCALIGALGVCLGRDVGSGTSTFQLSIVVQNACQLTASPDLDFGQSPSATAFPPVQQTVLVLCTKGLETHTVGIDPGQWASGGRRRMAGAGGHLEYDLFKGATEDVWGHNGGARYAAPGAADGSTPQVFSYRASVYRDQGTPLVGSYSDVLVVDVTF